VPLATLTPSNYPFYRGAGFEVAGSWTWYEARAEHLPRRTAPYRARPVSLEDPAELADVYRRVAPTRHGAFDRGERFWRQLARLGKDKTMAAFVLDGPDGPAGWAVATLEFRPPGPGPGSVGPGSADIRGLAPLFTGFAIPDDLIRAGLLNGFDPGAVELLRAAFASPRPWTAELY
jgi:predicted acetyltransferase